MNFLSQGGKEVFVKFVLQAIPTFARVCFLLLKTFCDDLEQLVSNFLWHKGSGKRGSIGVNGISFMW